MPAYLIVPFDAWYIAGAGSVMHHIVANDGKTQSALGLPHPLFSNAIVNSVYLPATYLAGAPQVRILLLAYNQCFMANQAKGIANRLRLNFLVSLKTTTKI